jgi:rhodanese-related sulfurtransferase
MKTITPTGLKSEMEKDQSPFTLVDVRDAGMYSEKHISSAVNVPGGEASVLAELVKDKDAVLVFYGDHEEMDAEVEKIATAAESAGYTQVNALEGGLLKWMEVGGRVEFGQES